FLADYCHAAHYYSFFARRVQVFPSPHKKQGRAFNRSLFRALMVPALCDGHRYDANKAQSSEKLFHVMCFSFGFLTEERVGHLLGGGDRVGTLAELHYIGK